MRLKKGYFFVLEGIDGFGGETQINLLKTKLTEKGVPIFTIHFPDRKEGIGKYIYQYLEEGKDISLEALFLLYIADFVKEKPVILKKLEEGYIIIADRYFTSTLAYQSVQGISIDKALKIANIFSLPIPDLTFLLKISPETSLKRKYNEKGFLDRFESNKEFLENVAGMYEKLSKDQIFCKWKVIDGEKDKEEVFKEIYGEIKKIINF